MGPAIRCSPIAGVVWCCIGLTGLAQESVPAERADRPNTPTIDELLLFFPLKHPAGDWRPANLQYRDVAFVAEDQTKLHGWYCEVPQPRAVILLAHGNAGNVTTQVPWLRFLQDELRASVFVFDYRGFGKSEGVPTVEGVLADACAARAKLCELAGLAAADMVVMGESLGGAIAVHLAAESNPRALVLQSTFASLKEVAEVHYPNLAWLVPATKLNTAGLIGKYRGPLLQSHGQLDQTIPFAHGLRLHQSANEPKTMVTIPRRGHNDWRTVEYCQQLKQFLAQIGHP